MLMMYKLLVVLLTAPSVLAGLVTDRVHSRAEVTAEGAAAILDESPLESTVEGNKCDAAISRLFQEEGSESISFAIHHNGDPNICGSAGLSLSTLQSALSVFNNCDRLNKFQVESLLTDYFTQVLENDACGSVDNSTAVPGFEGFCDMGPLRTVRGADHANLVPTPTGSLPCRFYTREGVRITLLQQLVELATQQAQSEPGSSLNLYAVPAGRVFMFAPSYVGERFELTHVQPPAGAAGSVTLTVISLDPRVFDISNFFTLQERDELLEKALNDNSPTHGFHRSTTGIQSVGVFSRRTSENAWDTHGRTARTIKRRSFDLLGFDQYHEEYSDGLQILRYNETKAYIDHMDYLDNNVANDIHDYDTAGKGSNRFATVLLYMSDMGENDGGETMFPSALPPGVGEDKRLSPADAIEQLRQSGVADMLKKGSWEEEMTAVCRNRLAVRPNSTRAVLFYSQYPNGKPDPSSKHGSCPVLHGTKLAASLWVWNSFRPDFPGSPRKRELTKEEEQPAGHKIAQLKASFRNTGQDRRFDKAELYYDEDGFFGRLMPNGPPIHVNTFETHLWNIKVDGKILKTFTIGKDPIQEFVI